MKQVAFLYAAILAVSILVANIIGYRDILLLMYGAISLMALLISATFLWLWHMRATPLALGMSLSWAGLGLTFGVWWLTQTLAVVGQEAQFIALIFFLCLLICGATLHFSVIQRTFGLHGIVFIWPVVGAFIVSLGVLLLA